MAGAVRALSSLHFRRAMRRVRPPATDNPHRSSRACGSRVDPARARSTIWRGQQLEILMTAAHNTAHAAVGKLIADWAAAARAFDIDRIMASYAPDIVAFDAIAKLRFDGVQAYREHWLACAEMCPGPMVFEIHDLAIQAGDDIAFAHYLIRCGVIGEDGKENSGYMRATVCCRNTDGRWLIAHEHYSVPFDPASSQALLGLEP
jgi:uncharacterized protein (TIGR02246 family)